jgi:hypothetical protein
VPAGTRIPHRHRHHPLTHPQQASHQSS